MSSSAWGWDVETNEHGHEVGWRAPGECGAPVDPEQVVLPDEVASMVDGHLWPSRWPGAAGGMARLLCPQVIGHPNWEIVDILYPELFALGSCWQVSVPPLMVLWHAVTTAREWGYALALDVQVELVDGAPALSVWGAGVRGWLSRRACEAVAPLLTTCGTRLVLPEADQHPVPGHTWWTYTGQRRRDCPGCPACQRADTDTLRTPRRTGG